MRVCVTGATGFVGRHVLAELARRGIDTVACRRAGSPAPAPVAAGRRWIDLDMDASMGGVHERMLRPDVLLHLAWGGLPNYRSLHHFETELPRQYDFLSSAVRGGLGHLVVAGTCFEYGMQSGPLAAEAPTKPNNAYGFAKDALRKQLLFLQREQAFALSWCRLFYVYGEGQAPTSLYASLRRTAEAGEGTFAMSGGEQLRDYLPIEIVARRLVDQALAPEGAGTVNLCSGVPRSVRALAEHWIAENGWTISLDLGRYPYHDHEPFAFWGEPAEIFHVR